MKMRKIMAAGIAATMAVTSLAAVASAETLTFNMAKTEGTIKFNNTFGATVAFMATTEGAANENIKGDNNDLMVMAMPNIVTGVKMQVTGTKGTKDNAAQTYTYDLDKCYGELDKDGKLADVDLAIVDAVSKMNKDFHLFGLKSYKGDGTAPLGAFVPSQYVEITEIKFVVEAEKTYTDVIEYNATVKGWGTWENHVAVESIDTILLAQKGALLQGFDSADAAAGTLLDAINTNVAKTADNGGFWFGKTSESTTNKYAFLNMTTDFENETILRDDVVRLSDTDHYNSTTDVIGETDGENQTYDDNGMGTLPYRFAGLASQVADFFNHKTNGTITMKFATVSPETGWLNGGVPSTEVGLRADLEANNFALFVNYSSSTGSLQAVTSVDKNAGTVTFDISEVLADLGGQTKGVVTDIYYGLNQGLIYGDPYGTNRGLLIEEITLAYEDDAAEEDIPAEEEVVEEEVTEEEVTEEEVTEEEEEVTMEEEEETTEEEEVDGEMFEEEEAEEEDVNPGTGVALAVVPAMIAAAAAVVSKKRK